jgi:pimeloyl-ACP methyl ester carboxylesterase
VAVAEHTGQLDDQPVFWRAADDPGTPVVYLHGVPDSSDTWVPFLERVGGVAPDLPGFGRSTKRGDFDYSIAGYHRWLERFLDLIGVERFRLVVHDWGAVGLALAQRQPERVERLVVCNAVPFLPGYRWHWIARAWRRPLLGEVAMGLSTRWAARRLGTPEEIVQASWPYFDPGTQRAILRLYRSAPEDRLAAAGQRLGDVEAPALVVWGEEDPYLAPKFADAYSEALPNARLRRVPGAGHWPWLDVPSLVDEVCRFLAAV